MSQIVLRGLTKRYGEKKGIFDLDFTVPSGEVFGYLGPNGSGKTTTIRHLMGFLNPDSGSASIGGLDCRTQAARIQRTLGYLPGEIAFFGDMKGLEYLRFIARMRGMRKAPRMDEMLWRFSLDPSGRIKRLSKGMKQKLALVTAFMHDPETLVLDEPTAGLDPLMQGAFVALVHEEKKRGKTILMSSHSFEEIEKTSDRAGILKDGRLTALLGVKELTHRQRRVYMVSFDNALEQDAFRREGLELLADQPGYVHVGVTGDLAPFLQALAQRKVTGLSMVHQGLEQVFTGLYGGGADDSHAV